MVYRLPSRGIPFWAKPIFEKKAHEFKVLILKTYKEILVKMNNDIHIQDDD